MTTLLQLFQGRSGFRRRSRAPFAIRFANKGAKPAGFVPVIPRMLRPACRAGKALCLPQRSSFGGGRRECRRKPPFTLQ
jgi:hypothetical protein